MSNLRHLLSFLAGELARAQGKELFAQICASLCESLSPKGVFVCEWDGPEDRPHGTTLAFWHDGKLKPDFGYELFGKPCHRTVTDEVFIVRKDLAREFPDDPDVEMWSMQSYVGVAFADAAGKRFGHIALFDDRERDFTEMEIDAIRLCATRAGAELQRLRSERSLCESEHRYHSIFSHVGEAILIHRDGAIVDCNNAAISMFACPRHRLVGVSLMAIAPDLQSDGTATTGRIHDLNGSLRGEDVLEQRWTFRRDGSDFEAEVRSQWVTIQGRTHIVSIIRDVSQDLAARNALVQSERTFRMLLEHSPVAIVVSDSQGAIEFVNRHFAGIFGYSREDLSTLERWWPKAFPDSELQRRIRCQWDLRQMEAEAERRPETRPINANVTCRDGAKRFCQIHAVQIGEKIITTFLDLSEQQQALHSAERAREQAEAANRTKDQFLAALSHELRTPLTPVLIASSHLQSLPGMPGEARDPIDVIRRNVEMEARLIDDLLDLARITNGKLELHSNAINVHDVIEATLQICWSDVIGRKLQVVQELDADHPWTLADPARLQQVLWNLLKNAIKFTPPGGRIAIRTRNSGPPAHRPDEPLPGIEIDVHDTGVGMTQETIANLFNAFQQGSREITRQFGGLGLGLSISRAILDHHGASIKASSDGLGKGSLFTVSLYTCPKPPPAAIAPPAPASAPSTEEISILLVEDHHSTGQILKKVLERFGHKVTWAQSLFEGQEIIKRRSDFDVLISDLGLPDGSGAELMPVFRERTGGPGIALSGYGMDHDIERTREAGFSLHLIKPVDVHRLREAIGFLVN